MTERQQKHPYIEQNPPLSSVLYMRKFPRLRPLPTQSKVANGF